MKNSISTQFLCYLAKSWYEPATVEPRIYIAQVFLFKSAEQIGPDMPSSRRSHKT